MGAGAGKSKSLGASRHTSKFKNGIGTPRSKSPVWQIDSSHKQVFFTRPLKSPSLLKSPVLGGKEAKDCTYERGFFSQSCPEGFFGMYQKSTRMPELLGEHLQAANLSKYIPAVSQWMEKEGVLNLAELEALELQDLYEELGLSPKCRHLFDICLGLYLEVLVKRQSTY